MTLSREIVTVALSQLPLGVSATVHSFRDDCPPQVRRRLISLGFVAGTTVHKSRRAPLGDPAVYRVMDYEICLRAREADAVLCEVPSS
ncbi:MULTISPECIES: FeoA family protein [unclassified Gordonia (in: high G+C Gram-positive bacteria)]